MDTEVERATQRPEETFRRATWRDEPREGTTNREEIEIELEREKEKVSGDYMTARWVSRERDASVHLLYFIQDAACTEARLQIRDSRREWPGCWSAARHT